MSKRLSIADLYSESVAEESTLFPSSDLDFWADYATAHEQIDRYFENRYHSFLFARSFKDDASDSSILSYWKNVITSHFFINAKRYNELYRVQVLDPESYDIINNYDVTETSERDNTGTQGQVYGQRTDSTQYGQTQQTNLYGQTQETTQYGQTQETTQYGQKQLTDVYGQRQDSNQSTLGQQTSTSTDKRSAFNSTTLQDVAGGNIQNGSRQDSATLTTGTHTDTHTDAQRTDTTTGTTHSDTLTGAQHTDTLTGAQHTDSTTKGQQSDTRTDNLKEEYSMRRRGNIGVQTVADVVGGFIDLWSTRFNFYQMIFDEITTQYLCVDDTY